MVVNLSEACVKHFSRWTGACPSGFAMLGAQKESKGAISMKYCTHCGAQLPDDAQFCPGCGKAAGDGTSPTPTRKIPLPALLAILAVALGGRGCLCPDSG